MKVPDKNINFPLKEWISKTISGIIGKFISDHVEKNNLPEKLYSEGIKNSVYLSDIYVNEYLIVYTLRTHPAFLDLITDAKELTAKKKKGFYNNQNLYWQDSYFSKIIIDKLLSGEVTFTGVEFAGSLRWDLVKPLLSEDPPMLEDITTRLHNQIYYTLEKNILNLITDWPEEIFTSAIENTNKLINLKKSNYVTLYQSRNDEVQPDYINNQTPDYDLWYTQRGTQGNIDVLLKGIDISINNTIDRTLQEMHPGYEKVEKSGLEIVAAKYNDIINSTQFYWSEVDYTTITDKFINEKLHEIGKLTLNGTPELMPEQMNVSGLMMVKSENKFLKAFTMREIAMGLPQRESSIFNSLSYDYEGTQKKLHSQSFERMIRELPDQLESFLIGLSKKVDNDPDFKIKLSQFYKITFQLVAESFLFTASESVRKPFIEPIRKFVTGIEQPQLVNVTKHELSDLICIKSDEAENETLLLFVSSLTGDCKVIAHSGSAFRNNIPFQRWLSQHLSAVDRCSASVADDFLEYKHIVIGQQILRIANKYPLIFFDTTNHQNDLCYRHSRKVLSDAESLIKTASEKARDYFIDFISLSLSVLTVSPARTLLGFVTQFIIGTVGISTTEIIRFFNSDNRDGEIVIFWNVLTNLTLGLVLNAAAVVNALKKQLTLQAPAEKMSRPNGIISKLYTRKIVKHHLDQSYKVGRNLIAEGTASKVYKLNSDYLIKDYNKLILHVTPQSSRFGEIPPRTGNRPLFNNSLIDANNSAVALNRLYGAGSASIILFDGPTKFSKSVSLRMKMLPGESLSSLLKNKNKKLLQNLKKSLSESGINDISENLLKRLKLNGIVHHDINLGNIIYDKNTNSFSLVDFDSAVINPVKNSMIDILSTDKYDLMKVKLVADLKEFARLCDDITYL